MTFRKLILIIQSQLKRLGAVETYSQNFDYQQLEVNPLLSCNWDQGSSGTTCAQKIQMGQEECLAGCVAISMGQIMYYWGYLRLVQRPYNHWDYGYQYANFQDAFMITVIWLIITAQKHQLITLPCWSFCKYGYGRWFWCSGFWGKSFNVLCYEKLFFV